MYSTAGTEKYSVQYYGDGKIQFYNTTGTENNGENDHVSKIPYYYCTGVDPKTERRKIEEDHGKEA